jgi:DNA polymerase III delta prime subunit
MFGNQEHTLYVEKYRPEKLDDYVGNSSIKEKVNIYLQSGDVPHLLLYGTAGTGKTTLAKLIAKNIDCDLMYINASDENNVDTVREKIKNFASTIGFRQWKLIILDESDYLTPNAQAALRNLMETFSKTTRFILTCNYVEKIIDPIQSRCQVFAITPPSKKDVAIRVSEILKTESVSFKPEDLVSIINSGYPDIRRILNSCQRLVVNGELKIDNQTLIESNYLDKIIELLSAKPDKKQLFNSIRQLLADSQVKDYTSLYRYLYDSLTADSFAAGHIAPIILIIAEAQYQDSFVVDKEINVMSMFIKIINEIY